MKISYLPFKSYIFGALALIPFLTISNYNKADYTFSSQTIINGTLGLAKRLGILKAKIILRESNSIFELLSGFKLKIYSLFYNLGYKGSSLVICQTDYMKDQLVKALPDLTLKMNLVTVANPFNFDDVQSKSGALAPDFKNKRFLVAAGRLAPAKGFDLLITAFSEIQKEHIYLELIILGEGGDRQLLDEQIHQLDLQQSVHLPGYVRNVYSYFRAAEACILSSRIEGFPNVLLQMMSQNTTVVATHSAGGIDEISGIFTCPPEDTKALENSILEALETKTEHNRKIFDAFLKSRTQIAFYSKMMQYIE